MKKENELRLNQIKEVYKKPLHFGNDNYVIML
jgi:hypothetical protein